MKVAFDAHIFNLQDYGGISRYFVRLATALKLLGQDPKIFAGVSANRYLRTSKESFIHGRIIKRYPPGTRRLLLLANSIFTPQMINRWQPDVIHETYYSARATSGPQIPRVITIYDMIHELYPQHFGHADLVRASKCAAVRRAAHIICISHNTRKDLIELMGVDEDRVSVIHLGIDPNFASQPPCNLPFGDCPFILYVGGRRNHKNFLGMLRAISTSERLKQDFKVIAFGGGTFTAEEKITIAETGFGADRVIQFGGSDRQLASLYKQAAAFVYPSMYEGFGLPPLEAMICGCPVVASNSSSIPEVVGDAAECFVADDLDEMRQAIENVMYDSVRASELRLLGIAQAARFTWEDCARHTIGAYQSVAN